MGLTTVSDALPEFSSLSDGAAVVASNWTGRQSMSPVTNTSAITGTVLIINESPRTTTKLQQASTYVVLGGCRFNSQNASSSAKCAACSSDLGRLSSHMGFSEKCGSNALAFEPFLLERN